MDSIWNVKRNASLSTEGGGPVCNQRFLGMSGLWRLACFCFRLWRLHSHGVLPQAPHRPCSRRFL